jgi:hypothetical protein
LYAAAVTTYRLLKPVIGSFDKSKLMLDAGNWHGNDSAWRMVSDLMKVIIYADKDGIMQDAPQRKVFCVIDGIIGGEKNGPLAPDEKKAGVVICGLNPLAVDVVGARLMGFDWKRVRYVTNLFANRHFDFYLRGAKSIKVASNKPEFESMFDTDSRLLQFTPHPGWRGHLELIGTEDAQTGISTEDECEPRLT